jgi:putative Mn2+ efflux pump MntP
MDFLFFITIFLICSILAVIGWKINPVFSVVAGLLLLWLGFYGLVYDGSLIYYIHFYNETADTVVTAERELLPSETDWKLLIYSGIALGGLAEFAMALLPRKGGWKDDPLIGFRGRR